MLQVSLVRMHHACVQAGVHAGDMRMCACARAGAHACVRDRVRARLSARARARVGECVRAFAYVARY